MCWKGLLVLGLAPLTAVTATFTSHTLLAPTHVLHLKGNKNSEKAVPAPAPAAAPSGAPGPAPAIDLSKIDPWKMCDELCKYDTGMDADHGVCVTDCRSYVDAGGDIESLRSFVTDETYNEQGGEKMEKYFETKTGMQVPDCKPTLDMNSDFGRKYFDLVDANNNGELTRDELNIWGKKACVPNEMAQQIFDFADANFDDRVTPAEYGSIGEDTDAEDVLDKYADKETKGEDQYEPVQMPAFRHVDGNKDGQLDQVEIMDMFKREIKKRIPTMAKADVDALAAEHQKELLKDMHKVDTDADGKINEEEYKKAAGTKGMGEELAEAADVNNNLTDPDDLPRAGPKNGGPGAGSAAAGAPAGAPAAAAAAPAGAASSFLGVSEPSTDAKDPQMNGFLAKEAFGIANAA